MTRSTLILFLFIIFLPAYGSNTDSIWGIWNNKNIHDTLRLKALDDIIWDKYMFTKPDSAYLLAIIQEKFARKQGRKIWYLKAQNSQAVSYQVRGNYFNAEKIYIKVLASLKKKTKKKFQFA